MMTTTQERLAPPKRQVLDAVCAMAPSISARAVEIERARRVPIDLIEALTAAGCFRMLLPPSHAGDGAALPAAMRVYEALGRADGSVGWTVMIGASAWIDLAALPRTTFDSLYSGRPDVIVGGSFSPTGKAVRAEGGFRIRGRWAFASGCQHCTWLYGHCIEDGADAPGLRMVAFAPDQVRIEDTWHVAGLCGTGSHHFTVDDLFVPAERTYRSLQDEPSLDEPIVRIPAPTVFALQIASVAVGIALGALDDVLSIAARKVPLLAHTHLAGQALFQYQLAAADAELRAARALLYQEADGAWATAVGRAPFEPEQRARIRSTTTWVAETAAKVTTAAYHAGGGSALYLDNPLQRRLRDIHALMQHFLVRPDTFVTAGAVLAGQDADLTIF